MGHTSTLLAIVGTTASGKTDLALSIAERLGCAILCVDSMQVYRSLDIGTAKPTQKQRSRVPHYGLDLAEPSEPFHAMRFETYAVPLVQSALKSGTPLILCGGTGLYFRALLEGFFDAPESDPQVRAALQQRHQHEGGEALYAELERIDPATAATIHPNDARRVIRSLEIIQQTGEPVSELRARQQSRGWLQQTCFVGIERDPEELAQRIQQRSRWMYDNGLVEETQSLIERGCDPTWTAMQALGYKECHQFLTGEWTRQQALEETTRGTVRYARRQRTWFRHQTDVHWLQADETTSLDEISDQCLNQWKKRGYNSD